MRQQIKKVVLIGCGLFFVLLGMLGAVLPLLPTTPFLLLAVACFANSSPRFHQHLLNNRYFGQTLKQWEENKTISRPVKTKAMGLVTLTFTMSIFVLKGKVFFQVGLAVLGISLLLYLWRLKEGSSQAIAVSDNNT